MVAGLFCAWLPTYLRPRSGVVRRAKARRRALRAWGLGMLRVIGVRLSVEGKAPPEGILVVSNHLGYLDIPVLGSVVPMVFVAKAELRRWPFWGFVAKVGGTIFVDRATKRDVLRVRREMREALARGDRVLVFPEATSTGGEAILPFKPALLADAAAMEAPVHWLTVSYTAPLDAPPARYSVAWGSDVSFLRHLLGLFAMGRANCTVRFGDTPVRSGDRKELAVELRRAMLTRFEAVAGWEEQAAALVERAWRTRREALRSPRFRHCVTARIAAQGRGRPAASVRDLQADRLATAAFRRAGQAGARRARRGPNRRGAGPLRAGGRGRQGDRRSAAGGARRQAPGPGPPPTGSHRRGRTVVQRGARPLRCGRGRLSARSRQRAPPPGHAQGGVRRHGRGQGSVAQGGSSLPRRRRRGGGGRVRGAH